MSAIASYVSVDVRSASAEKQSEGGGDAHVEISDAVATHADAILEGIESTGTYWERSESPLVEGESTYRYYARARVPKRAIAGARASHRRARSDRSARKQVVLLPFGDDAISDRIYEGLWHELARSTKLAAVEPELARALAGDDDDAIARASELLIPDRILSAARRVSGDRVRLTLVERDGEGRPLAVHSAVGKKDELGALALEVAAELGDVPIATRDPHAEAALDARSDSGRLFREGKLEEALAAIQRAIDADPNDTAAYLRAGRILERMGRLGRIAVTVSQRVDSANGSPRSCTPAGGAAIQEASRAIEALAARRTSTPKDERAWWSEGTLEVGEALRVGIGAVALQPIRWSGQLVQVTAATDVFTSPGDLMSRLSTVDLPTFASILDLSSDGSWAAIQLGSQRGWVKTERLVSDLNLALAPHDVLASVPEHPSCAAEAYLRALGLALRDGDERRARDPALALADLGVRADRYLQAFALYDQVTKDAEADGDLNRASLSRYGHGVGLRKMGRFQEAEQELLAARSLRVLDGKKPYLLEIDNELGDLQVERDRLDEARDSFARALRLAGELDNAYVSAILENNLGVLDLRAGRLGAALDRFDASWKTLTDLRAADGRIASGLNLGIGGAERGDLETARQQLVEVGRIVESTMQESSLAELRAAQANLATLAGRPEDALAPLAEAWFYAERLGRASSAAKLQADLLAAEARLPGIDADARRCLASQFWSLGAPVFDPVEQPAETIDTLPPRTVSREDLLLALDAAAVLAITDFRPRWAAYRPEAPPPPAAPTELPAVSPPLLGDDRAANVRSLIAAHRAVRARLGAQVEQARTARDVVRLRCLTEKISEVEGLLRIALASVPASLGDQEYTRIEEAYRRAAALEQEASTCLGQLEQQDRIYVLEDSERPTAAEAPVARIFAPEPPPPTARYQKSVAYERVLGAFTVETTRPLLLDPTMLSPWSGHTKRAARMLAAIADDFGARGDVASRAAALLDLGAARWFHGDGDPAYEDMMEARRLFARIGDRRGLAHADEWIGFFLTKSDRPDLAADHLRLSRDLFESLGDDRSAARAVALP